MVLQLSKNTILEIFDEGGLLIVLPDFHLVELDKAATDILKKFDGAKRLQDVAIALAKEKGILPSQAIKEVQKICRELKKAGILQQPPIHIDSDKAISVHYAQNPKIIVKEPEDNNSAILFNQETNELKIINMVGWYIWQKCSIYTTLNDIVNTLAKAFTDVPQKQVARDINEFLINMSSGDFLKVKTRVISNDRHESHAHPSPC